MFVKTSKALSLVKYKCLQMVSQRFKFEILNGNQTQSQVSMKNCCFSWDLSEFLYPFFCLNIVLIRNYHIQTKEKGKWCPWLCFFFNFKKSTYQSNMTEYRTEYSIVYIHYQKTQKKHCHNFHNCLWKQSLL